MRNPFRRKHAAADEPAPEETAPPADPASDPSGDETDAVDVIDDETAESDAVGPDLASPVVHEPDATDGGEDTQASAEAVPVDDSLLLTSPVSVDDPDDAGSAEGATKSTKPRKPKKEKDPVKLQAKRFRRRRWRRRLMAWKWVIALLLAIVVLSAGIWALYFSSFFSVRNVEVEGADATTYVKPEMVTKFADVPTGEPLLTADLDLVRTRVQANLPPLKTVEVSRKWPDTVLVSVTMRTPVALVSIGGELRALDADGTVFLRGRLVPKGLPRVHSTAGTDADALSEAAQVADALPQRIAPRVDYVSVETIDSISLRMRDGRTVVWGSAQDSGDKARTLLSLMKAAPRAAQYDVSVPSQPQASGRRAN